MSHPQTQILQLTMRWCQRGCYIVRICSSLVVLPCLQGNEKERQRERQREKKQSSRAQAKVAKNFNLKLSILTNYFSRCHEPYINIQFYILCITCTLFLCHFLSIAAKQQDTCVYIFFFFSSSCSLVYFLSFFGYVCVYEIQRMKCVCVRFI